MDISYYDYYDYYKVILLHHIFLLYSRIESMPEVCMHYLLCPDVENIVHRSLDIIAINLSEKTDG